MKVKISMDSACDLCPEIVSEHNIGVAPLSIVCGDTEYKDGIGFTPEDIYRHVEAGGTCTSAAINVAEYTELFETYLREYDAVVHINISSEISVCYQNARIAAEGKPVYAIDSRNLSSGAGLLAFAAAELAGEGLGTAEIADRLHELIGKVETSFVIDSLKYLHRGGRCSGLAALGANILKLKPCIEMENGKMDVGKKYRGQLETVLLQYVKDKLESRGDINDKRIFITHTSGFSDEFIETLKKAVLSYVPFNDVREAQAGCTIANHCGPLTLGILYFRK